MAATIFGTRNIVQHNKWGIHRKKQSKIHRVPQIIELEIPNLQLSPKLETIELIIELAFSCSSTYWALIHLACDMAQAISDSVIHHILWTLIVS